MPEVCDIIDGWADSSPGDRRAAIEAWTLEILDRWGLGHVVFREEPPAENPTADGAYFPDSDRIYLSDALFSEDRDWERAVVVSSHEVWHAIEDWLREELGFDPGSIGMDEYQFADSMFTTVLERCEPFGSSIESSSLETMTDSGWESQPIDSAYG
jgi:hypothetical protein